MKFILRFILLSLFLVPLNSYGGIADWQKEWPNTDFSKSSVPFAEIISGGPGKDGIPSIDKPKFKPINDIDNITETEPVMSLSINGDNRAYPLRIMIYHEIVNDIVGGVPVVVSYCPLCNSSIVFERQFEGKLLEFGTTGKLRHSDLVMYDRLTESWWQQFSGKAIVGKLNGKKLKIIPSRLESFALFKKRYPDGKVLVPGFSLTRAYGRNPYVGYDSSERPFFLSVTFWKVTTTPSTAPSSPRI